MPRLMGNLIHENIKIKLLIAQSCPQGRNRTVQRIGGTLIRNARGTAMACRDRV
jgi:hypothetical protein